MYQPTPVNKGLCGEDSTGAGLMNFCVIITHDYGDYADALAASLQQALGGFRLYTLVIGGPVPKFRSRNIVPLEIEDVQHPTIDALKRKYLSVGRSDEFRWSMKSVFLSHLLDQGIEKVVFVDPDICFFADPAFLFDQLDRARVLLTPHWRCPNPTHDESNFRILQTDGLFNAGFVGVSQGAQAALKWWGEACLYRCDVCPSEGFFVDQAYLDMMPIYFEDVEIVRHRGCNVANWNLSENTRELIDGRVLIRGHDPVIFIHFTASTIRGILDGRDAHLRPHLDQWFRWRGVGESEYDRYLTVTADSGETDSLFWRGVRKARRYVSGAVL